MPILLVFALTAACLPVEWPAPLMGGGVQYAAVSTGTAIALSLLTAMTARIWVIRAIRLNPARKPQIIHLYSRFRRFMFFANLVLVTVCIVVLGWGWAVQQLFLIRWNDKLCLAPFAELMVPLPYFLILFGAWTIYFDAERVLHCTSVLGPVKREFFGRAGYLLHQLRQFGLLVMLPVILVVTYQSSLRFIPETARSEWFRIGSIALILVLFLVMPLLIKPVLGLKTMPRGPFRDRLETMARRLHFRCTDYLLWPTHGAIANAMIVGILPHVRYVVFTDRLLDELPLDELDAVFGHEVGHAKHGHIAHYAVFLILSITALSALLLLIAAHFDSRGLEPPAWAEGWIALPPFLLAAIYVFVVFGFLSRRCERQADVYGCRSVSCGDPACQGHDHATIYPDSARGLCPTGIRTFIRALERVELVNDVPLFEWNRHSPTIWGAIRGLLKWLRSWLHSTMASRIAFLQGLIGDPRKERRFQVRITLLRWGLLAVLAAALAVLGQMVGWSTMLNAL
jgi:Zn-dependent protease with chaperone function